MTERLKNAYMRGVKDVLLVFLFILIITLLIGKF